MGQNDLQLPFWALRLLKPCKVKRFLAAALLSEVGLVALSSDPEEMQEEQADNTKIEERREVSSKALKGRKCEESDKRWE